MTSSTLASAHAGLYWYQVVLFLRREMSSDVGDCCHTSSPARSCCEGRMATLYDRGISAQYWRKENVLVTSLCENRIGLML